MQLQKRKVSELKNAHYNPASRTEGKQLNKLIKSIEEIGLIYPIAITKDGMVIEGHRRLAAIKEMGWEEVPVIVINHNPEEVYASLANSTRRLNGNEALNVYLKQPLAVSERLRAIHAQAEDKLGRDMLVKMAKMGTSITMYRWAKQIASYCDDTRPAFMRKAARWMMKHRSTKLVTGLMALSQPADTIRNAIIKDKPITAEYKV